MKSNISKNEKMNKLNPFRSEKFRMIWVHAIAVDRVVLFAMSGTRGAPKENPFHRSWRIAFLHALIISQITFWSTLGSLGTLGLLSDPLRGLFAAMIPTMVMFFTRLGAELGLER